MINHLLNSLRRFYKLLTRSLCKPPPEMKQDSRYYSVKYSNIFLVASIFTATITGFITTLIYGYWSLQRLKLFTPIIISIFFLLYKKSYQMLGSVVFLAVNILFFSIGTKDPLAAGATSYAGLIILYGLVSSKIHLTLFFVISLIFMQLYCHPLSLDAAEHATREELAKIISMHAATTFRFYMASFVILISQLHFSGKITAKLRSLQQIITAQNKKLIEINETLKKTLEAQETFILSFSHETRNPLNGLLGNLELINEKVNESECKTLLHKAQVCAKILKNFIITLLETRKMDDKNDLQLNISTTDMLSFLQDLWVVCSEMIKSKNLKDIFEISRCFPRHLRLDQERLCQVVFNLVKNASKFTHKGHVRVTFLWIPKIESININFSTEFRNSLNEDEIFCFENIMSLSDKAFYNKNDNVEGSIFIRIEDTGIGMKEEKSKDIFEKFSQIDDSNNQRLGMGLGLWITKTIVDKMNGRIFVETFDNLGSTFIVEIPVQTAPNPDMTTQRTEHRPPKSLCALVVEDSVINQVINESMLRKYGFSEILKAANGKEGVDIVKSKPNNYFDLITMDLEMPVMDGKEAIKLIRKFEKQQGHDRNKILIISANATVSEIGTCLEKDGEICADGFLPKPSGYNGLCGVLKPILKNKPKRSRCKKKILIVDDDFFNLEVMKNFSSNMDVEFIAASDGVEAVNEYKNYASQIGLVLIDYKMPRLSGLEAAQQIQEFNIMEKINLNLPIYLLTGHNEGIHNSNSPFKEVIQKPISINNFRNIIESEL